MSSSILYQNDEGTIILLDLPRSLELSQAFPHEIPKHQILSRPAPTLPFQSQEPTSESKRLKLLSAVSKSEQKYHESLQHLIHQALVEIASHINGSWCLARHITTDCPKFDAFPQSQLLPTFSDRPPIVLSGPRDYFRAFDDICDNVVTNPSAQYVSLEVEKQLYRIPPMSAFLLSDVQTSRDSLSKWARALLPPTTSCAAGTFDFIVIDPPWPNRSAKRSRAYITADDQAEKPFETITPHITKLIAEAGIIAIWITNKSAVKAVVLATMQREKFTLFEEWIWAKTTASGEPVTALTGIWRRPYEICLLFRSRIQDREPSVPPKRRIVVAVADVHSRKPSLRELLQNIFHSSEGTRGLEMFGRSLTSGWWTWGNEAIMFANERDWRTKAGGF